ncbi:MAG: hypothetical protein V3T86_17215 [Planctomycetota bacterium]
MQPIPRRIAGLAILSFLGACASVREARNPEQARYLAEAENFPLEFSVALSDFDAAVDRAHEWLGTDHGRTTTEVGRKAFMELMRAFNVGMISSHGYWIAFTVKGGSVGVHVWHTNKGKVVSQKTHFLAYYIKTGKLMPE